MAPSLQKAAQLGSEDYSVLPPRLRELVLEGRVQLGKPRAALLKPPPKLPAGATMTVSEALEEQRSGD